MKVVKFGGSSLATGEQFEKVIKIVSDDFERKVIVTSAPGKRFAGDTKVTDLLIEYAKMVLENEDYTNIVKEIVSRYRQISDYFQLDESVIKLLKEKIVGLAKTDFSDEEHLMAAFKAHGEFLNAILLNKVLNTKGIKSIFVDSKEAGIIVHGKPNDADISNQTYVNLEKFEIPEGTKAVFPGFFGYSKHGSIYTFSRGGSDITGAMLSRGLHADLYENFTDVDAIYVANNHVVKHPQAIKKMSYREMRELSYAGFSVFQDEAIIPAVKGQVPVNVKNTNNPDADGTMIVPEQFLFDPSNQITGIACSKRFSALYIHRYLLNKEVGFTLKLLQIFYKYNISYEHMPSGIDDLTVIFDRTKLDKTTIKHLCHDVKEVLQPDYLEWMDDYAIIMVVGEGIAHNVNTIGEIIDSLTENNIAIHMINQGASRISIMIGIQESDADNAVNQIYKKFFN
ncbi:aspartate kinase [Companilactobacillus mindensis DSM 14500]|uniref:Aspartokinase n=1 Tax=Companilactobacillus mindensis DSM 14500 TaxID=1423770 RepID=A0A0R1QMC8_9LACO|nr:aspartate kinase [Companilactobacillus mindensis]KRL43301.1 aspartate kinase [Companilactobacillus mindensis DSM 14500]GEO79024.1 aspartokinase [Companilactobacillus mindensis]